MNITGFYAKPKTNTIVNIKLRLILMNFLQFFIWGSWLITIGAYWFQTLPKIYPLIDPVTHESAWTGSAFGALFSTMGIASLFMPSILGIIAAVSYTHLTLPTKRIV